MIVYVDTSTLIKLLIEEDGSDEAGQLWDSATSLSTARIAHVEARAALAAAERQRRISPTQHGQAVAELDRLWAQLSIVEVGDELVRSAGDLAARHALRGYDAVHLAAALQRGADVLSSADHQLCTVASAVGLHVANPGRHEPG